MSYRCTVCGELHDDLPDLGSDRPDGWWGIPAEERSRRVVLTADTCVIDDEDYYIRGVIEIPIHGQTNRFGFGAWVSQKRENFLQYVNNPNSANIGPFFGWLCTRISYYEEETLHLKSRAHFRGGGAWPLIDRAFRADGQSLGGSAPLPQRDRTGQGVGNRALLHAADQVDGRTPRRSWLR